MSKTKKASMLAQSLKSSMAHESEALDDRFAAAEAAMAATGGNLLKQLPQPVQGGAAAPAAPASGASVALDGFQIQVVPIETVHDNPENSRQFYPSDELEELEQQISAHGQLEPIDAMPHPERPGHWLILSGHKRVRVLRRLGETHVRLVARAPVFGLERYKVSRAFNTHSRETALDNARAWKVLVDAGHASYDEIAEALGVSKALLSKTLAFNKLPQSAIARIKEHPEMFGPGAAQSLSQIAQQSDEERLLELIEGVIEGRVTTRQLEHAAKEASSTKRERRPKHNSRQYKVLADGREIGVIKDWDDGRVQLMVSLDDPAKRAHIVDLLKRELGVS